MSKEDDSDPRDSSNVHPFSVEKLDPDLLPPDYTSLVAVFFAVIGLTLQYCGKLFVGGAFSLLRADYESGNKSSMIPLVRTPFTIFINSMVLSTGSRTISCNVLITRNYFFKSAWALSCLTKKKRRALTLDQPCMYINMSHRYGESIISRRKADFHRMVESKAQHGFSVEAVEASYAGFITEVSKLMQGVGNAILIDVRSPLEYGKGHVISSVNIPLFSDKERTQIGARYNLEGRDVAIDLGLSYASPKFEHIIKRAKNLLRSNPGKTKIVLYCYRGGLRSRSVAWLLAKNGLDVQVLEGGYKAYRRWYLDSFLTLRASRKICVIGGKTGTGKTDIIQYLQSRGMQAIDLEAIAKHKGSAFGSIPFYRAQQPTNEMFANILGEMWNSFQDNKWIFLEDEGNHIGSVSLPENFYKAVIRSADLVIRLDAPLKTRIENLMNEYANEELRSEAKWMERMESSLIRVKKRLGQERYSKAMKLLNEGEYWQLAELMLTYYDKLYERHIQSYDGTGSGTGIRKCPIVTIRHQGIYSDINRIENQLLESIE